jgi:Ca2+-transporting ATPase
MNNDTPAFAQSVEDVLAALQVQAEQGLSRSEVNRRLRQYGKNRLEEVRSRPAWKILLDQFKSLVVIILAAAGALAFAFGEWPEGVAIIAVILVNTMIGFVSEWKAVRSMEALRQMGTHKVRVRRDGMEREIPSQQLVPGDIVIQEGGDVVPADLRLIEANNIKVNEAPLTGESVTVSKITKPVEADTALADRHNMLYKGTTVTEGSGDGVVVATGMKTELGRIAELTEQTEKESTNLQKRLNKLGGRLALLSLCIAAVIALLGLWADQPIKTMIETAIALGVAAIPEGLPIVATIALARGMWVMAHRQALIENLPAVETLGSTSVIFTDKTGTLTENRMQLRRLVTPVGEYQLNNQNGKSESVDVQADNTVLEQLEQGQELPRLSQRALEISVLCSNARLTDLDADGEPDEYHGDPTEIALLQAGMDFGLTRDKMVNERPEQREVSFDPAVMMMATFHKIDDGLEVAVKGSPQSVIEVCNRVAGDQGDQEMDEESRNYWLERGESLAEQGLRVLAVADKQTNDVEEDPYTGLRFVGLVGLLDPPRAGVREAIAACRRAGIEVVMVTGDQPATAGAIARALDLADNTSDVIHGRELGPPEKLTDEQRQRLLKARIFARVNPEQKLQLLELFQKDGNVVAMTGDGINDTPALKKADIGIAMGRRGTDAAREAADMVLKDDAFSSIEAAVEQGRIIFGNIRNSSMFMLCTNVAEVMAVALASMAGVQLPLLPLQILFLNVLTDVFPAMALGVGPGDEEVMDQPPRDINESIMTSRHWGAVMAWGAGIAACVLGGLAWGINVLDMGDIQAVTISFLTLAFAKLWFVFNLRGSRTSILKNNVVKNPWIWASLALCVLILLGAVYLPGLSDILKTYPLDVKGWLSVFALSLIPLITGQFILTFRKKKRSS